MQSLRRFFHTARHLKPIQVAALVRNRLPRRMPPPRETPGLRPRPHSWTPSVAFLPHWRGSEFGFGGDWRRVSADTWDDPQIPRLWRYNLHYFDDLSGPLDDERKSEFAGRITRWIAENPVGKGIGWEPYPTSLRISNWIKAALGGMTLPPEAIDSLAVQARWLAPRFEFALLGNHLIANAKALLYAGCYFAGPEAEGWLAKSIEVLTQELAEQILPDGGHCELSPMYHGLVLLDILDIYSSLKAYFDSASVQGDVPRLVAQLAEVAPRMVDFLHAMTLPDNEIGLFNDAAWDVAPSTAAMIDYATRCGLAGERLGDHASDAKPRLRHFPNSGYARLMAGPVVLLADVGRIGIDHLPGHAHADTLSFELSHAVQRIFVNSGTSVYKAGSERQRQRSTASHNTVLVDGQNSSDVYGAFRVGRRAVPLQVESALAGDRVTLSAAHSGYAPRYHSRRWELTAQELVIHDSVRGRFRTAVARFHVHPGVEVELNMGGAVILRWTGGQARFETEGEARVLPTTYHPRFGETTENRVIEVNLPCSGTCVSRLTW